MKKRIWNSVVWLVLGAGIIMGNSGCVYWRLHQLRNQMSAFPDNFRIEEREQPTIVALRPVLQPDDLGWLTGLPASETIASGAHTTEIYHYVKQYSDPEDDEQGAYDFIVPVRFNAGGRMHEIQAPARFAPILTEDNFDEVFRPMRDGSIERMQHATGWWWEEHRVNIPVKDDIMEWFGVPYAEEIEEEGRVFIYVYQLKGNEKRWNPTGWDLYARFVFEPDEERVIFTQTYVGRIRVIVDLRAEKNQVEIKRL